MDPAQQPLSAGQVIRYRTGHGDATKPGLVLAVEPGALLIEENYRFISPSRTRIAAAAVVEVLRIIEPL